MYIRGDFWHYDFIVGGRRYRGSTGFRKNEKSKAQEVEAKLKVQMREGHSIEMIWEQTKRKMLAGHELALSYETMSDAWRKNSTSNAGPRRSHIYLVRMRKFCDWMNSKHPEVKQVSEVMTEHANEWFNDLRAGSGSSSTKNDYLKTIRMIFKALGKNYGIVENPFAEIAPIKKDQTGREAFTPEELTLIGKNAKGWIFSLCLTAMSTGLREGDICMLLKSSVNLQTDWISIPRTRKTGVAVDIPILPGLHKHLEEMFLAYPESDYVFPELAKKYKDGNNTIGVEIKSFFNEIGINGTVKKVDGYRRKVSLKDVHSFRHTFIYLAAVHGIPFPIVQGIVGHTSPEMTKHYMDHAGRDAKTQYLRQLPDYLTTGGLPEITEQKKPVQKVLTSARVLRILQKLTPKNLERNKQRLTSFLLLQ